MFVVVVFVVFVVVVAAAAAAAPDIYNANGLEVGRGGVMELSASGTTPPLLLQQSLSETVRDDITNNMNVNIFAFIKVSTNHFNNRLDS